YNLKDVPKFIHGCGFKVKRIHCCNGTFVVGALIIMEWSQMREKRLHVHINLEDLQILQSEDIRQSFERSKLLELVILCHYKRDYLDGFSDWTIGRQQRNKNPANNNGRAITLLHRIGRSTTGSLPTSFPRSSSPIIRSILDTALTFCLPTSVKILQGREAGQMSKEQLTLGYSLNKTVTHNTLNIKYHCHTYKYSAVCGLDSHSTSSPFKDSG
ncbi:unnamed protein product, partial [Acanthoscelides obtectus]